MKKISRLIKIIGILLLCIVIYKVGWKETFDSIKRVPMMHCVIALLILWTAFVIKSIRWMIISKAYGIQLTVRQSVKIFFIGLFLANITPGRLGDFGRLFYIKDQIKDYKIGVSSLVMDRLFDLICLLIFTFVGLIYYQVRFDLLKLPSDIEGYGYWLFSCLLLLILFLLFKKKVISLIRPWIIAFRSHNLDFTKGFIGLFLTIFSMIFVYGMFNYMAWAMKIPIEHLGLFLGSFILGILSLLPITVLGIGVREASIIVIFDLYGLPASDAVAISLIVFALQLASFLPGVLWFYLSPIALKDIKNIKNQSTT